MAATRSPPGSPTGSASDPFLSVARSNVQRTRNPSKELATVGSSPSPCRTAQRPSRHTSSPAVAPPAPSSPPGKPSPTSTRPEHSQRPGSQAASPPPAGPGATSTPTSPAKVAWRSSWHWPGSTRRAARSHPLLAADLRRRCLWRTPQPNAACHAVRLRSTYAEIGTSS